MRFHQIVLTALLVGVSSVGQSQEGIKSPRDVASGQATELKLRASNSHAVEFAHIVGSELTSVSRSASGETSKQVHKPRGWKMTLAPGGAPRDFSFGLPNPTSGEWVSIESLSITLVNKGAACTRQCDAASPYLAVKLGDIARFFDSKGKPIPAKGSGQ